jgi:hypothetical protein
VIIILQSYRENQMERGNNKPITSIALQRRWWSAQREKIMGPHPGPHQLNGIRLRRPVAGGGTDEHDFLAVA